MGNFQRDDVLGFRLYNVSVLCRMYMTLKRYIKREELKSSAGGEE